MKISRLMEQHRTFANQGLPDSLGDGFLMAQNRIYRRVREVTLSNGYIFSSARHEGYETFPLLQLEDLLAKKVLPYTRNALPFDNLTLAQSRVLYWDDVDGNLKRNFVYHEACHGIARIAAQQFLEKLHPPTDRLSQQRFVLRMFLEESFANTCELLGVVDANDQFHRIFYEMNSYVCEFDSRTQLAKIIHDLGPKIVFKFFILAYLHSNFLCEQIDDRQFQDILKLSKTGALSPQNMKSLRALSKVVFNLNERFRYQTASFHLRLAGIQTPLNELVSFDFIAAFEQEKGSQQFLDALSNFFCLI